MAPQLRRGSEASKIELSDLCHVNAFRIDKAKNPSTLLRKARGSQDHGASGRSSGSSLLSTAASSSITCGSSDVPRFQVAETTVKAEYGAKRY